MSETANRCRTMWCFGWLTVCQFSFKVTIIIIIVEFFYHKNITSVRYVGYAVGYAGMLVCLQEGLSAVGQIKFNSDGGYN